MNETKSCSPKKRAAATKAIRTIATRFCRGLSVPFTVNVLGEPRPSGRRGHVSIQHDPLPASRSTRAIVAFAIALFFVAAPPSSRAQDPPKPTEADSAAIKQTFADFYESFSRHDAHATAMTFAEDGDFTNMRGIHRHGRTEIEAWFANLFKGNLKSSNRTDTVRSIRFFSPQVATVDADTVITGTKAADGSDVPPRKGLMIVTMTKQNGRWLISVFHEAEFPAPPPAPANGSANRPAN
jgi:uncharacterized protein (TIGR02246 family)